MFAISGISNNISRWNTKAPGDNLNPVWIAVRCAHIARAKHSSIIALASSILFGGFV
jgi:hypothetical protein